MDIDTMPAGREMDTMIADKIFGHTVSYPSTALKDGEVWRGVSAYSTNISDAWEMVEHFEGDFSLWNYRDEDCWACEISTDRGYSSYGATSAPLAICRAMLKAVMGEGNG